MWLMLACKHNVCIVYVGYAKKKTEFTNTRAKKQAACNGIKQCH